MDIWKASVLVGHGDRRMVICEFERRLPSQPNVYADGPTDSPHRYADRGRTTLCLWLPGDMPRRRWRVEDGLLALFGVAAHHLVKEAWWRETGEWLGEEAPHDDDIPDDGPVPIADAWHADPTSNRQETTSQVN